MNKSFSLALMLISAVSIYPQNNSQKELTTVAKVDLKKYMGRWYEIARLPNSFQKKCVEDVSATYSLQEDGRIRVVNRCRNEKGDIVEAVGEAKRSGDDSSNAKLKVRFAPKILSFLPFVWGNYWIIDLGADYEYVVVGEPDREYFWILSRTPQMEEAKLQSVISNAKAKGYDLTGLIRTKQSTSAK